MKQEELIKIMISNWKTKCGRLAYIKKYFSTLKVNPYSAGIDFSRQNLTYV